MTSGLVVLVHPWGLPLCCWPWHVPPGEARAGPQACDSNHIQPRSVSHFADGSQAIICLFAPTQTMSYLIESLHKGLLGGITATALLHGVAVAHPYSGPHPHHQQTKSAAFLRDCGYQTPASVQSVSRECPNIKQGLLGPGSSVHILNTVQRHLSGQRGLWYEVRIVQNRARGGASVNAHSGMIGWLRANKF